MLFQNKGAMIIMHSLLEAKWQADQERRREAENRLDLYRDDYEEIIRNTLAELFHKDNFKRLYYHVNQSQNLLKRVVNEISTVYKAPALRSTNPDDKRFGEIVDDTNLHLKMKKINRYTNLLNETIVKIGVRENKIVYDILTPNVTMVVQNYNDPTQADAIIYQVTYQNTTDRPEIRYYYWDTMGNYKLLDEKLLEREIRYTPEDYPYKDEAGRFILPFVVFHRTEPDDAFFDQDSGRDLYNAAIMLGVKMTLFDYYFKVASFKQPYIIGDEITVPAEQVADPLTFFRASGQGAQVGTLDLQINIDQLKEALIFQINSVINNYGISADAWSLSIAETSGRALKIKNRALMEYREDQIPIFRRGEEELFEKTRIVNNAHAKQINVSEISKSAKFKIDFGEIEFPEDPALELKLDAQKLKLGLLTPGAFYLKYNPDLKTVDEAEKRFFENLDKLDRSIKEEPSLDEAIDYILGKSTVRPAAEKTPAGEEGGQIQS